jgi:transposase
MNVRRQPPLNPMLIGYDPEREIPPDHLSRLVDRVVDESIEVRGRRRGPGQPGYDPRMTIKVLIYGYATGVRSSRQMVQQCEENLAYKLLTRGEVPSHQTLCTVRVEKREMIEEVWVALFEVAEQAGLKRLGRLVVDSTKMRANVSSDSVVGQKEYSPLLMVLDRILEEAEEADRQEDGEEPPSQTKLGKTVSHDQMRDILRNARNRWRKEKEGETLPEPVKFELTPQMVERIEQAKETIEQAQKEERKHVSLTDPDAQMMPAGRERNIKMCHSFEAAVDNGLLIVGQSTQERNDNDRLRALLEEGRKHEPNGVGAMDGDSGYYSGDEIARLLNEGIDVCVPDSNTSWDLRYGRPVGACRGKSSGSVSFEYDCERDVYICPEGNELHNKGVAKEKGQLLTTYKAIRSCQGCPLSKDCLKDETVKRRTIKRGAHHDQLIEHQQRFANRDFQERYRNRGPAVETVFAWMRTIGKYTRWFLRGKERVACEATVMKTAYQFNKVHKQLLRNGVT